MKRASFELRVTIITLLLFSMVAILGLFAYKSYNEIVNELRDNTVDNAELVYTKATLENIYRAGINVKSYTITKDSAYLNKYEQFRGKVYDQLAEIESIDFKEDHQPIVDSIIKLSYLKVDQMDSLLKIHVAQRVNNAIDTAYQKIMEETEDVNASNKKSKIFLFFNNLKKKKDKGETEVAISEVEESLSEVKETEAKLNEELIQKELILINYGNELAEKISYQITKLESLEADRLTETSKKVKKDIQSLNNQVLIICAFLVAFLALLVVSILSYIRKNTRVRLLLKKAKKEAERLAKAREEFIANVSHEIRTPMNAISGFTDQIAKGPLTTEQREHVDMVRKSTAHLLHLVNDVLDISKLQRGKVVLEELSFNANDVFADVASFIRPLAEEKNSDLILEIKSNTPSVLCGDIHRLQQILLNILSNAVKFTENGKIKMEVFPTLIEQDQVVLNIIVSDTGIGMTQEQLKKIFQEFEQAQASTTRNYGGTGLGLPITKRLISLFNGSINIESEKDKGTKVVLELPFKFGKEEKVVKIQQEKEIDTDFLIGKRILVVDDEPFNRKLLRSMLKDKHVELSEAENGKEAVKLVKSNDYDVVLMDVRMPELNGMEATKKIRKINDHTKKDVLIIALTAAVTDKDKQNYLNSGMNGLVPKPFKELEVITAIYKGMNFSKKEKSKQENTVENSLSDFNEMNTEVDFSELVKLSGNDQAFYRDMLQTFINGAEEALENIKNAQEKGALEKIPNYAHKISAPARHLGAEKLYKVLKKIELDGRKQVFDQYESLIKLLNEELKAVLALVKRDLEK